MSRSTIRGALGQIKQSYFTAAILTGWRIECDEVCGAWMLSATIETATADAYRLTQPDLKFVVVHQAGAWRWPVAWWEQVGTRFTAQLGPLEDLDRDATPPRARERELDDRFTRRGLQGD